MDKRGQKRGHKRRCYKYITYILVKDGIISVEDAAKRANLSVSTFQKYLNEKM